MRPPKSVSIVALTHDPRIVEIHDRATRLALTEVEVAAQTRVRRDGATDDRDTGNIVAALFRHDTSREQDPLLHTHCVVFNATYDEVEGRWKALQNRKMLRTQKLASAIYDQEMVKGLRGLGYEIEHEGTKWEIKGIGRELIERMSKRRAAILAAAREAAKSAGLEVSDYELRDRIARDQRKRKIRDGDPEELRAKWRAEIGDEGMARVRGSLGAPKAPVKADVKAAAQWARELVFERQVAVTMGEMEAAMMRRVLGQEFTREDLRAAAVTGDVVRKEDTDVLVSVAAWEREARIVSMAKLGKNEYAPIAPDYDGAKSKLDDEQREAVRVLVNSRDFLTNFRGQAGTGKTTALHEFCAVVKAAGKPLVVVTPQGVQAQDLRIDGIEARTVAAFLHTQVIPHGAVVVIDEAGQVSGKDMAELFTRVDQVGGRVVTSGDTGQHGAVEASDSLRCLEKYAKPTTATLTKIRRQDPSRGRTDEEREKITEYRHAVRAAAVGKSVESLSMLMKNKAVQEVGEQERPHRAAAAYIAHREAGETALIVSQTRDEVAAVNRAVADAMEAKGMVRDAENVVAYQVRDMLKAEKRVADSYAVGDFVKFSRGYGAIEKGDLLEVTHIRPASLVLRSTQTGKLHRVQFSAAKQWEAAERRELRVGVGTTLQLRTNGLSRNGREHANGELVDVLEVWPDYLRVRNRQGVELTLDREKLVANLGYAVTSFGAQGKTVDHVVIDDAGAAGASHEKEWYVTLTRGRRSAEVFTCNARDLAQRIAKDGERELALDHGDIRAQKKVRVDTGREATRMERLMKHGARVLARARVMKRRLTRRILNQVRQPKPTLAHGPRI